MKKIINILSILGIVVAPCAIASLYLQETPALQASTKEGKEAMVASEDFPLNQTRFIDFKADEGSLERLTKRERMDQFRDWLMFTVVSNKNLSTNELNQSLYDIPTVRYGYMKPVSNFEYGESRSLYIGNGQVIALLPKSLSQQERTDELAHIADKHRKDTGKIPTSLEVFEYEINPDKQFALLTRREVLDAQKLLTKGDYGYHEAEIKSLEDLERFMNQVDDVTFAQIKDSTLQLGGRKISSRQYRGIRVEDVAAIWQSEKKIQTQIADFDARWQEKSKTILAGEQDKARQEASEEWRQLKLVNGSGFSLDPSYDYPGLKNFLAGGEPVLQRFISEGEAAITEKDIQNAKSSLTKENVVPFLELADKLTKSNNPQVAQLGNLISNAAQVKYSFQAARYDGDLQGTEVGMVLFYTDLLAKLWGFNYQDATPEKYVQEFKPKTKLSVSSIYKQELKELPNTRTWFAPNDKGFQVADGGNSILFARNATRIYAASSNPLRPGAETTAAAISDIFLAWWNSHYEEVARYEPQYERLNEIMKWSLLMSWLNKDNKGELLGFLQGVEVKRDNWFPDWVRSNSNQLKFQKWDQVRFYERGYKGSKTEAMPVLVSDSFKRFGEDYFLSGGVSLASKDLIKERPTLPATSKVSELGLRSNLNYGSVNSNGSSLSFNTLENTTYNLKSLNPNLSLVTAKAKEGVKFRSPESELANREFSRNISRTDSGIEIKTSVDGTELGSFSTAKTGNGFSVGWRSMDINRGQSLALHLSQTPKDIGTVLLGHPDVASVVKLGTKPPPQYLVKMQGSDSWLKLAQEAKGSANIPPDWQSRVSGFEDDSRNILLAWEKNETVAKQLAEGMAECIRCDSPKGGSSKGTIDDNPQNKPYDARAQDLAKDPLAFLAFNKAHYNAKLKQSDQFLKAKNYVRAEQHIDDLIQNYGPQPKLMLRKAVAAIGRGRLNIALVTPGQPRIGFLKSKLNFFDEVNGRLGHTDREKFARINTDKAVFYVEDHPGLNNLDVNPSIPPSTPQTSVKTRLYRLQPGDIAGLKLSTMGFDPSASTSASTQASTHFEGTNLTNYLNHLHQSVTQQDNNCENSQDAQSKDNQCNKQNESEKPTYILLVSDKTT